MVDLRRGKCQVQDCNNVSVRCQAVPGRGVFLSRGVLLPISTPLLATRVFFYLSTGVSGTIYNVLPANNQFHGAAVAFVFFSSGHPCSLLASQPAACNIPCSAPFVTGTVISLLFRHTPSRCRASLHPRNFNPQPYSHLQSPIKGPPLDGGHTPRFCQDHRIPGRECRHHSGCTRLATHAPPLPLPLPLPSPASGGDGDGKSPAAGFASGAGRGADAGSGAGASCGAGGDGAGSSGGGGGGGGAAAAAAATAASTAAGDGNGGESTAGGGAAEEGRTEAAAQGDGGSGSSPVPATPTEDGGQTAMDVDREDGADVTPGPGGGGTGDAGDVPVVKGPSVANFAESSNGSGNVGGNDGDGGGGAPVAMDVDSDQTANAGAGMDAGAGGAAQGASDGGDGKARASAQGKGNEEVDEDDVAAAARVLIGGMDREHPQQPPQQQQQRQQHQQQKQQQQKPTMCREHAEPGWVDVVRIGGDEGSTNADGSAVAGQVGAPCLSVGGGVGVVYVCSNAFVLPSAGYSCFGISE